MVYSVRKIPGRTIDCEGRSLLYFGGTAYLGLQSHPVFQARFAGNISRYGTSYGSSRQSNVRLPIFEVAEDQLANWAGSEACLTLSSGFLAAQFLIHQLSSEGIQIFHAPRAHEATRLATSRSYSNVDILVDEVLLHLDSANAATPAIVFDTNDFTGGPYPYPDWIHSLPLERVAIVADDSHGLGVMGQNGSGALRALCALPAQQLYVCSSLAKACGLPGGALFGPREKLETWRTSAFFAGASPMMPAALATFTESTDLYHSQLRQLQSNISLFQKLLPQSHSLKHIPQHPTYTFQDEQLAKALAQNDLVTTRFRYPSIHSAITNRIVLNALHLEPDLAKLANCISKGSSDET